VTNAVDASVIVNNFDYAPYLRDAIASALEQTHPSTEVVVVDDGSTDDSREIIASYGRDIVPVLKDNGGQASAFNAGLAASRGELVVFLDADDALLPHAVERAAAELGGERTVKVHWPLLEIDAAGRRTGAVIPDELAQGELIETVLREGPAGHGGNPPSSGNAWRREYLDRIFPVPEEAFRIWADVYLLELAPIYGRIARIDEPLGLYRVHGENRYATRPFEERLVRGQEVYEHVCRELCARLPEVGARMSLEDCRAKSWFHRVAQSVEEICAVVPPGESFVLVDGDEWGVGRGLRDRRPLPLPERDGEYWGLPADSQSAVEETERLREAGAGFLVVAWPAFWWLSHYARFGEYLESTFRCVDRNERVVVYELR
jgi:hypothetical protein